MLYTNTVLSAEQIHNLMLKNNKKFHFRKAYKSKSQRLYKMVTKGSSKNPFETEKLKINKMSVQQFEALVSYIANDACKIKELNLSGLKIDAKDPSFAQLNALMLALKANKTIEKIDLREVDIPLEIMELITDKVLYDKDEGEDVEFNVTLQEILINKAGNYDYERLDDHFEKIEESELNVPITELPLPGEREREKDYWYGLVDKGIETQWRLINNLLRENKESLEVVKQEALRSVQNAAAKKAQSKSLFTRAIEKVRGVTANNPPTPEVVRRKSEPVPEKPQVQEKQRRKSESKASTEAVTSATQASAPAVSKQQSVPKKGVVRAEASMYTRRRQMSAERAAETEAFLKSMQRQMKTIGKESSKEKEPKAPKKGPDRGIQQ